MRKTNIDDNEASTKRESVLKKLVQSLRKENEKLKSDNEDMKMTLESNETEVTKLIDEFNLEVGNLKRQINIALKCDECGRNFKDKNELNSHMMRSHKSTDLNCDECNKCYASMNDFRVHIMENHVAEKFNCEVCDKIFRSQLELQEHTTKIHFRKSENDRLQKQLMEMSSKIKDQKLSLIEDLYKLKMKEVRYNNTCNCRVTVCKIKHSRYRWKTSKIDLLFNKFLSISKENSSENLPFSGSSKQICKKRKINQGYSDKFKCNECETQFDDENELNIHEKDHHKDTIKCSRCEKTFLTDTDLSEHFENIHLGFMDESIDEFQCEECDNVFDDIHDLEEHKESNHMSIESYDCRVCGNIFVIEGKLKKHLLQEHGSKYECQHCGKYFEDEKELMNHIDVSHQQSPCEMTFLNPSLI